MDAVPYSNPDNYVRYSGRRWPRNLAPSGPISSTTSPTARAHYRTTGPEIFEQTGGQVDGFICAVGSGGTLAGVAAALRERKPGVKVGLADRSRRVAAYSWYEGR
ncbi:pyridoxal-phosphate dependent enzyme [Caulobacter segnis]